MSARITSVETLLLAIPLPQPFRLGFGELFTLPRVLLLLHVQGDNGEVWTSVGEAAIDFPFSAYDAWDVYYVLQEAARSLEGHLVSDREAILVESWEVRRKDHIFAAQAALNMALDDAAGRKDGVCVSRLYGRVPGCGQMLDSVPILEDVSSLEVRIKESFAGGAIPKLKCDENIDRSCRAISAACSVAAGLGSLVAVDFNASLDLIEWRAVLAHVRTAGLRSQILFIEQPTKASDGVDGMIAAARLAAGSSGLLLVADEVFETEADAVELAAAGVALNMKIQKVGGLVEALRIESAVRRSGSTGVVAMVGGTFPTALGRAYDQHAASVLSSVSLPSDAWQPSTSWFRGAHHLILEAFPIGVDGRPCAFTGGGLGCEPDWTHISALAVASPSAEYALIRTTGVGKRLEIHLRDDVPRYPEYYEQKTGRLRNWNIVLPEDL